MAIELEVIQGIIKLKDEYTDTLETVTKGLSKFAGEHTAWVAKLTAGEGLVAASFVTAGVVIGAELVKLGNDAEAVGAQIGKLATQFNVPVSNLSDLRFAIKAAGGDFDEFGNSLFMFQKRLEDNADAVDKGLNKLGLDVEGIKSLRPDEQFLKISDAMRTAGTEVNKSAVAFEIFGRQGREILPLLLKPLSDLTEESEKLGNSWATKEVEAAKAFRAEMNKMGAETEEVWTMLGREVAPVTDELTLGWQRMKLALANVSLLAFDLVSLRPIAGWLGENALAAETAAAKQDVINKAMSLGAEAGIKYGDALKFVNEHLLPASESIDRAAVKIKEFKDQLVPLSDTQQQEILDLQQFGVSLKETADLVGSNVVAVKNFIDVHKETEAALKKSAEAADKWAKTMEELNTSSTSYKAVLADINGATVEAVKYYLQAGVSQQTLATAYGLTASQIKAVDEALKAETKSSLEAKQATDAWAATLASVEFNSKSLQQQIETIDGTVVDWAEHLLQSGVSAKDVASYYGLTDAQVRALEQDMANGSKAADSFGNSLDRSADSAKRSSLELADLKKASDSLTQSFTTAFTSVDEVMNAQGLTDFARNQLIANLTKKSSSGSSQPVHAAAGGTLMVGEEGPEMVQLPYGSTVYPTGSTGSIVNHIYINDTLQNAARRIKDEITKSMKQNRHFQAS